MSHPGTVLAQLEDGYVDEMLAGDVFQALLGPFADTVGLPLMTLIVFGSIGIAYYARSGKATMPAIMTILIGGVTMGAHAPAQMRKFAVIVVILSITGIGYSAWQRAGLKS